jgi:hypothetical protein
MENLTPMAPEVKRALMEAGELFLKLVKRINDPAGVVPFAFPLQGPMPPEKVARINEMLKGAYRVQLEKEPALDPVGDPTTNYFLVVTFAQQ